MTGFWLIILAMTLIAALFVIVPLLRIRQPAKHRTLTQSHLALYREQLAILEQQLLRGEITQTAFAQSQLELQKTLVQNVPEREVVALDTRPDRLLAITLFLLFPLLTLLWYWQWGASHALQAERLAQQQATVLKTEIAKFGTPTQIAATLRTRLQQEPDSAKGWYLLGSLELDLQHYPQAVSALARANQLQPDDVNTLVKYASALFFTHHQALDAQASSLLQHALQIAPQNTDALNLLAIGAYQTGDYATAIRNWEQLLPQFPPSSADNKILLASIANAHKKLQQQQIPPIKLSIHVALAPSIPTTISPAASVFIYAVAATGSRAPLALVRKQVKDLPCSITLSQDQAMISGLTLANANAVRIYARISPSGQAMPQAGDWQGISEVIAVQHAPSLINVIIKQRILK